MEPIDERSTRVILRSRTAGGWTGLYEVLLIELPHFIMERKMLLGIKARAEQAREEVLSGSVSLDGALELRCLAW